MQSITLSSPADARCGAWCLRLHVHHLEVLGLQEDRHDGCRQDDGEGRSSYVSPCIHGLLLLYRPNISWWLIMIWPTISLLAKCKAKGLVLCLASETYFQAKSVWVVPLNDSTARSEFEKTAHSFTVGPKPRVAPAVRRRSRRKANGNSACDYPRCS